MAEISTRQRALDAALELFSRRGYDAVSMGDIAGALEIKAPSLYKHFKNKEELYAALIPPLEAHYTALWEAAAHRQEQLEHDLAVLGVLPAERLEQETMAWLQGEMTDPRSGAFRRFLTQGQFQAPTPATHWLWLQPLVLYESFFSRLVDREDVVQDAILRLLRHTKKLKQMETEYIPGYITFTVRSAAIDLQRKRSRTPECALEGEKPDDLAAPLLDRVILEEDLARLRAVWPTLTPEEQLLLEGKYLWQYTDEELSEALNCQKDSVRMMLTQARRRAWKAMNGEKGGGRR